MVRDFFLATEDPGEWDFCGQHTFPIWKPWSTGRFWVYSYHRMSSQFFCANYLRCVGYYMVFFISFQQTFTRHKTTGSISTTWDQQPSGRTFPTLGALCDFLHLLGLTLQGVGVNGFFFGKEKLKHEMKIHHVGWRITIFLILRYIFFSDKNSWSKNSLEAPIFFYGFVEIHKKQLGEKVCPKSETKQKDPGKKKVENWMFKEDE